MTSGATQKTKDPARKSSLRRLAAIPAKLRAGVASMIAAHEARVGSLRVFDATRMDGAGKGRQSGRAPLPSSTAVTSARAREDCDDGLFARLKTRFGRWYRAHESRVAALRVYSRNRSDARAAESRR